LNGRCRYFHLSQGARLNVPELLLVPVFGGAQLLLEALLSGAQLIRMPFPLGIQQLVEVLLLRLVARRALQRQATYQLKRRAILLTGCLSQLSSDSAQLLALLR